MKRTRNIIIIGLSFIGLILGVLLVKEFQGERMGQDLLVNPDIAGDAKKEINTEYAKVVEEEPEKPLAPNTVTGEIKSVKGRVLQVVNAETKSEYEVQLADSAYISSLSANDKVDVSQLKPGKICDFTSEEPLENGQKKIKARTIIILN